MVSLTPSTSSARSFLLDVEPREDPNRASTVQPGPPDRTICKNSDRLFDSHPLNDLTILVESTFHNTIKIQKMKSFILASLIASAAAFAPAKQAAQTTSLAAFENELGAQAPLGFFDPLGLVADGDQEKFDRLRYVEIKHGRICMLGVVGYLVNAAGIYLPGNIAMDGTKFSDLGYGWDASFAVPVAGALQVALFVGFLELAVMKDITGGEFVGDFRNDFFDLGWDSFDGEQFVYRMALDDIDFWVCVYFTHICDVLILLHFYQLAEETKLQKRAIELNQGRAAQMGMLALMVHDKLGNVSDFFPN